ncbi:DUF368 domain-containing protein [Treponema sp.]|uniref:DUF368 domain-containing protein n=1 Tax=Treponema sp. TaxID=166 RepID=UPI0025CFDCEE|nr:DUF368 domain-containing protein [Treponema sp.]MCR5217301.1 DUF368 domain-containing protein [Treponema sp.]
MELIKLILKGIVLGVANVIPGVSGGTMAVVFNVYDRIIDLISPDIKKIFRSWKFWLPLVIGMAAGILIFSHVITYLLGHFPIPTTWFFIGLIIGSIPLILMRIRSHVQAFDCKRIFLLTICFIIGLAAVLSMIFFDSAKPAADASSQIQMDFKMGLLLFISGSLAALAMIIPGISGSLLLLALGMYAVVLNAVAALNIIVLLPFAAGVIFGLIAGAFLVRQMMKHIPSYTYAVILGLVFGSIFIIFPGIGGILTALISLCAAAAGILIVILLK